MRRTAPGPDDKEDVMLGPGEEEDCIPGQENKEDYAPGPGEEEYNILGLGVGR